MLVADAERDRYRDDAPDNRRPESIDELFVVTDEQNELVTATGTDPLQVIQDTERTLVQLGVGHITWVVLAFGERDRAGGGTVHLEQLGKCLGFQHQRRSSLMCNG